MFHCLSCWDVPSLGTIPIFSQFQVLLSHLWGLKKKKTEGRSDIKGAKEGVEQESRKEKKKVLKERKIIKSDNKELLLRKRGRGEKISTGFKLDKSVLLGFLAAANSGGMAELFFVSDQYLASLQSSFPVASGPIGSGTHPPPGYVCTRGAFHDAHSPWCLRSQVPPNHMLPGALDLGLLPPHAPAGVLGSWVESRLELLLQNSSKCPQVSFSF